MFRKICLLYYIPEFYYAKNLSLSFASRVNVQFQFCCLAHNKTRSNTILLLSKFEKVWSWLTIWCTQYWKFIITMRHKRYCHYSVWLCVIMHEFSSWKAFSMLCNTVNTQPDARFHRNWHIKHYFKFTIMKNSLFPAGSGCTGAIQLRLNSAHRKWKIINFKYKTKQHQFVRYLWQMFGAEEKKSTCFSTYDISHMNNCYKNLHNKNGLQN